MNSEKLKQIRRESVRKWRQANPERAREHCRKYYLKHREERMQYMRDYHRKIADKAKQFDKLSGGQGKEDEQ
jgi:hypothetical protein